MRLSVLFSLTLLTASGLSARVEHYACHAGGSLQTEINFASPGDTLVISGTCTGPFTIQSPLTIQTQDGAIIDGNGSTAITVSGTAGVTLQDLNIKNGINGVLAKGGAHLSMIRTTVHDNSNIGVLLEENSSANLCGGGAMHNTLNGVDAEEGSSVVISCGYVVQSNGVFGINVNSNSSLTLQNGKLSAVQNLLGIQIGTGASAFIADPASVLAAIDNATTGLTIVSGSHLVDFGGRIEARGNGGHGVSVDSKAGLDLDAAGVMLANSNGQDGVHLEENSVLTIFNTTAFSGAPGTTMLNAESNGANGINLLTGSRLTVIHQATINSNHNVDAGIRVDDGSNVTLIQSNISGNTIDMALSFGSHADIRGSIVKTLSCDASVLLRGTSGFTCPSH